MPHLRRTGHTAVFGLGLRISMMRSEYLVHDATSHKRARHASCLPSCLRDVVVLGFMLEEAPPALPQARVGDDATRPNSDAYRRARACRS